jgi:glycolate oxidase iron-sulfur subunit
VTGDTKNLPAIDDQLFLDCVHCGLCTSSCPTYVELGTETDGPRGRIYLMRAVRDGRLRMDDPEMRHHLDLCLDCRACESACPSGVQYGRLIEPFRARIAETAGPPPLSFWERLNLFHLTPYAGRMRWVMAMVRLLQRSGLDAAFERLGVMRLMPKSLRQMHAMLPHLQPGRGRLPEILPAEGKRRARVALFLGCAADALFPQTTLATARVLQHNGCDVFIPRRQACCGALHYHLGLAGPARAFADENLRAFEAFLGQSADCDAIVVNAAGCGAMLKDYGHLVESEAARHFAGKVRDVSEFLVELGPVPPKVPLPMRAVYHDACHLCHAQQIRSQPRQLLNMIPGLELIPLPESELCCGAAGSYSITQPEMAERLGRRKIKNILETSAKAVFAGNVGCLLQIGRYLRADSTDLWLAHPIDALWASYSGVLPRQLRE